MAAGVPEVSGSEGSVTLGSVAGSGIVLHPATGTSGRNLWFRLPPGATQGPDTWYLVRMSVSVTFARGSDRGSVLISASVGGTSSAQVEFIREGTPPGPGRISWTSADLIRGSYGGRKSGRTATVRHTNYLLARVVEGGPSRLTFQATSLNGADVRKVEIGASSGIYATRVGWVDLEVDASFPTELDVGEVGELDVRVRNLSRRRARDVSLTVEPATRDLFARTSVSRRIAAIDAEATRQFRLGSAKPGELRVAVVATEPGSGEEAVTLVTSDVTAEASGPGPIWRAAVIAALLGLLAIAALTRGRKRAAR
jgi:hypothetical protein